MTLINKQPRPCGNRTAIAGALRRARAITHANPVYGEEDDACVRIVGAMTDLLHLAFAVSVDPEYLLTIASSNFNNERKGHSEWPK